MIIMRCSLIKGGGNMRRRDNGFRCIVAAVLLILGVIFLCCISWRFMLFVVAAIFILVGIILIRKC